MLGNAEEKIEDHPVASAAVSALLIYSAIKLGSPKKDD